MIIIEWINLIKYQMLAKNSDIIATLRWVRLVHKCQIGEIVTAALALIQSIIITGTNRAVFSTSKVCQDALFIKHKYAQDDYNSMN